MEKLTKLERLEILEAKVLCPVLGVETAVENSKGAVVGTVDLLGKVASGLHEIEAMQEDLKLIKMKFNELRNYVKSKLETSAHQRLY